MYLSKLNNILNGKKIYVSEMNKACLNKNKEISKSFIT